MPSSMIQDDDGNTSSNRAVKLGWFILFGACLLVVTLRSSPPALPTIPDGWIYITGLVLTGGVAGKWLEGMKANGNCVEKKPDA